MGCFYCHSFVARGRVEPRPPAGGYESDALTIIIFYAQMNSLPLADFN